PATRSPAIASAAARGSEASIVRMTPLSRITDGTVVGEAQRARACGLVYDRRIELRLPHRRELGERGRRRRRGRALRARPATLRGASRSAACRAQLEQIRQMTQLGVDGV